MITAIQKKVLEDFKRTLASANEQRFVQIINMNYGKWMTPDEVSGACHIPLPQFGQLVDAGLIRKIKFGDTHNARVVYSTDDLYAILNRLAEIGKLNDEVLAQLKKEKDEMKKIEEAMKGTEVSA